MINHRVTGLLLLSILCSCALLRKPHINLPEKKAVVKPLSVDSSRQVMRKLMMNNLDFNTIQLKFHISYSDTNTSGMNVLAIIRMRRDSVIWVSVTAPIGVEGMRILITNDSIKMLDRLNKSYYAFDFKYLYQFIPQNINLHYLQDIIAGNAVFMDTSNPRIGRFDSLYLLQTRSGALHSLAWCGTKTFQLFKFMMKDTVQHISMTGKFTEFTQVGSKKIPSVRNYIIKQKERVQLDADLKDVKYNEPLLYPFRAKYK